MMLTILAEAIAYRTQVARCANNSGIPIVFVRKRGNAISSFWNASSFRKLNLSFNPIYKKGNCRNHKQFIKIRNISRSYTVNSYTNYTKYKEMTPSEFHHFNGFIKSVLHFMYRLNLHVYLDFPSYIYIMTFKYLKSHLQNKGFNHHFKKCCRKTIEYKLFKCYIYNNLKSMEYVI